MKAKTKKLLIAVCSLAVVLGVVATASFFAIFANRQKAETSIATGKIQVDLVEEFIGPGGEPYDPKNPDDPVRNPDPIPTPDPDDPNPPVPEETPGPYEGPGAPEGTTKIIKGNNTGTQPAYVRVRIFPVVETFIDGEWVIHGGIPANYIVWNQTYSVNGNWIYNADDDYYYYKYIVPAGEMTSTIEVRNLHADLPEYLQIQFGEDILRVNMLVSMESCQSSNGMYRQNWNIDKLPAGVEIAE